MIEGAGGADVSLTLFYAKKVVTAMSCCGLSLKHRVSYI